MTTDSVKCNGKYLFIQPLHSITYMWNLKKKIEYIETKSRMVVFRGWEWRKYGRVGKRVQAFRCKDLI